MAGSATATTVWRVFLLGGLMMACACSPSAMTQPQDAGGPPPGMCLQCTGGVGVCSCQTSCDCQTAGGSDSWICTGNHRCVQTCMSSADCTAPAVECLNAICIVPGCGDDSECAADQQCIAGFCATAFTAANVASCEVVPANALLNTGGSRTFSVISKDSSGDEIAYKGPIAWSASGIAGIAANAGTSGTATALVSGSTGAGTGTVNASIGTVSCAPARVSGFAGPASGTLRVTVADPAAGTVIPDATVIDGAGSILTPGGDGTYAETNPNPSGVNTVSVFRSGYSFVTVVGTSSTDLFLPIQPTGNLGKFTGNLIDTDFDGLSIPTGTVHIDASGSSVAGNLIDTVLSTELGALVPTMINLGGTSATNTNLPDGLAVGLGPTMFKGSYSILAPEGVRALWSLGGNITLQILLNAISMSTGGSVDIGSILTSVVPVLSELESGVTGGVSVSPGEQGSLSTTGSTSGSNVRLALNAQIELQLSATVPELPTYALPTDTPGMPTGQLNGAFVIGGVLASGQGFVPLGITGGQNDTMNNEPGQVAGFMGGPDGVMPLAIAPRSGGLEGGSFMMLALATDLSSVGNLFESGAPPPVLSGSVILPGVIKDDAGALTDVTFPGSAGAFLGVPAQPGIAIMTRTLSMPATDVSGVAFHRLDITSPAGTWHVYFPPGETAVPIPNLPAGFAGGDPLTAATSIALQSVTLNLDSSRSYSYDDIVGFQSAGVTVDDLSLQMDQFSVEPVPIAN